MTPRTWAVVEAYREAGRTHREAVEIGLPEEAAKEMAAEHNAMLRWVGVVNHWVEAVEDRRPS